MPTPILPLRDDARTWAVYLLLLIALALAALSGVGELRLDTHDSDYLLDSADTLGDPGYFWRADKRMPGRPGFELVLLGEYLLWGDDPQAFHLFGLFLHLCASLLLARLCLRLGMEPVTAFLSGLLFLLDAAHFQAVQWISAHCYPLALILMLAGTLGFMAYMQTGRYGRLALVYVLLFWGMLVHVATVAALPFFCYLSVANGRGWRRTGWELAPLGCLMIGAALGTRFIYAAAPQVSILAGEVDFAGMAELLLLLWGRLISTAHWFPFPLHRVPIWELALGGIALLAFAWMAWKRMWGVAAWTLWIWLTLLPVFLLSPQYVMGIPAGPSRYLYLASAGSSAILARLLVEGWEWTRRYRSGLAFWGLAGSVALLSASSISALRKVEGVYFYNAGRNYLAFGEIDAGVEQLSEAIARAPELIDLEDAYLRLCPMLMNRGMEVGDYLREGIRLFPRNPTLDIYRQVVESMEEGGGGAAAERLRGFKGKGRIAALIGETYYHCGRGLFRRGEHRRAVVAFQRSLMFNPQSSKARQSLAAALMASRAE